MKLGYLLPTRERIMGGEPAVAPMLALAEKAELFGYDSIWVGDSVLARPRHDPLTLLAAVAGRTRRVELGTAVLLPALRNPVLLAHQVATLDQASEGRLILGIGIATDVPNIRAEFHACGVPFEKRVGRMNEGLRLARALWRGEPVDWDGLWHVEGGVLAPVPHRPGGPPLWLGGGVAAARRRAGRLYDGWFPNGVGPEAFKQQMAEVRQAAAEAGRDGRALSGAFYLTVAIDDDAAKADARVDDYLQRYYGQRPDILRKRQVAYGGPVSGAAELLAAYAEAGVQHMVLRFVGDHEVLLESMAKVHEDLQG
jgi:probable F420-dependent oxidoreductase